MSGVVTRQAALLVGGFDLSCYTTSVEPKAEQELKDVTAICSTGPRDFAVGLNMRSLSHEGFFAINSSDDTKSIDKMFTDALSSTVDKLITSGQLGTTQGNPAIMMNVKEAKYGVKEKPGDVIMTTFDANVTDDGAVNDYALGVWLYQATVTGSATGATYDNAAGSTGWFCHAHNTDADGTATFKVQHSNDGSIWVDLITFSALAVNTASQSVDTATAVRRYLRVLVTGIGGTTSKISVAIKPGYIG